MSRVRLDVCHHDRLIPHVRVRTDALACLGRDDDARWSADVWAE